MADAGIKKYVQKYSDLPPISSETEGYSIRYRLISEDRNRTSHWSPVYNIQPNYTFVTGLELKHSNSNDINTITWGQVAVTKNSITIATLKKYDVWAKWYKSGDILVNDKDWIYQQRSETNSIVLTTPLSYTLNGTVINEKPNRLRLEVYVPGDPATRSAQFLLVYQNNGVSPNPNPFNV